MPFYNSLKVDQLTGAVSLSADASAGLIKVVLLSASYVPDIDTHTRYRDVSAHEVNITGPVAVGYSAGGQSVSGSLVFAVDNVNDRATFDAADINWPTSTIAARYAALVKIRSSGANKELDNLIGYIDFGSTYASSSGSFTIQWNSIGIISFS
jgi:hypothetical protein